MSLLKISLAPVTLSGFLQSNAAVGLVFAAGHWLWNPNQGVVQVGLTTLADLFSIGMATGFVRAGMWALGKTRVEGGVALALAFGSFVVAPVAGYGLRKVCSMIPRIRGPAGY